MGENFEPRPLLKSGSLQIRQAWRGGSGNSVCLPRTLPAPVDDEGWGVCLCSERASFRVVGKWRAVTSPFPLFCFFFKILKPVVGAGDGRRPVRVGVPAA